MNKPHQRVWEPYTGDFHSACTPHRLIEIKRRLNEIPVIWNSSYKQNYHPGDCVIGIFSDLNIGRAVILTENVATEVSLTLGLENDFNRQHICPGDLIGIKYRGRHRGPFGRRLQDEYALITDNVYSLIKGPVDPQELDELIDDQLSGEL